jgi:hypothetical protein
MRTGIRFSTIGLFMALALTGCSLPHRNPMPDVHSFFVSDPDGVTQYEGLRSEADHLLATCWTTHSCDRAHFLRGMVALYENRDVAASHFQVAVAIAPGTNTATSSLLWLQLLTEANPYSSRGPFGRATAQLVRELLKQELTLRQMTRPIEGPDIAVLKRELQAKDKRMEELTKERASSTTSSALQRELKARDKQLEDLAKQIEELKKIDLEMRDTTLPNRPSSRANPALKKESP